MRRADRVFAVICMGLSAWLILESRKYDYMTTFTPGPGFHPFWLGIILGLLSLGLLCDTFRRGRGTHDKEGRLLEKGAVLRAGLILIVTTGLALAMTKIGFTLASFLFVVVVLRVLEKYGIFKSVAYGVAVSGALYLIFRAWLNVDLPRGWLGL